MVEFCQSGGFNFMLEEIKVIVIVLLSLAVIVFTLISMIRERGYRKQIDGLKGDVEERKMMDKFERALESRMAEFSESVPVPKAERLDDYQIWILPEKQDPATDLFVPRVVVQYFWENEQYELRLYKKTYLRNNNSTGFQYLGPERICSRLNLGSSVVGSAVKQAIDLYEKVYRSPAQ
jgi:hypothetical protein